MLWVHPRSLARPSPRFTSVRMQPYQNHHYWQRLPSIVICKTLTTACSPSAGASRASMCKSLLTKGIPISSGQCQCSDSSRYYSGSTGGLRAQATNERPGLLIESVLAALLLPLPTFGAGAPLIESVEEEHTRTHSGLGPFFYDTLL